MKRSLTLIVSVLAVSACTTQLKVKDANGRSLEGFPVPTAELFAIEGLYTMREDNKRCSAQPFTEYFTLPTGKIVYVNVTRGFLAKSAFEVQFSENGSPKSVSLNSEPAAKEALEGATTFASAVLPFFGLSGAAPERARVTDSTLPDCDTGKEYATSTLTPVRT